LQRGERARTRWGGFVIKVVLLRIEQGDEELEADCKDDKRGRQYKRTRYALIRSRGSTISASCARKVA